jgi:hypothetical protein
MGDHLTIENLKPLLRDIATRVQKQQCFDVLLEMQAEFDENGNTEYAEIIFYINSIIRARDKSVGVNIYGGTFGNLSLGHQVGTITANVSAVATNTEQGKNFAEALSALTNALAKQGVAAATQKDGLDILESLSEEGKKEPEKRKLGIVRALLSSFPAAISSVKEVSELWTQYGPAIQGYFNL